KYPHSIPISTFKAYITTNQIHTNYYYNATPGAAQRDIKAALRVRHALLGLADVHRAGDVKAFGRAYREALGRFANSLASPSYAQEGADIARREFMAGLDEKRKV